MKVLSLKEPYASLIKEKIKRVETRSWKTNYRGELYIHASLSKVPKMEKAERLMSFLEDKDMKYGYIICKCQLVDCIVMTDEYIEKMRTDYPLEFLCGEYAPGRYAWILEDVEILDNPISAKGKLGIWTY